MSKDQQSEARRAKLAQALKRNIGRRKEAAVAAHPDEASRPGEPSARDAALHGEPGSASREPL